MSADIHTLEAHTSSKDEYSEIISSIRKLLNEELAERLGNMFNGADDFLFRLSEKAETNEEQTHIFDTIRLLRQERKNINQGFAEALRQKLQPISTQHENDQAFEFDEEELSLVDQDTMEEMVAISTIHSKAMNLYGEAVNHLEARLEFLAMKTGSIFEKDALSPRNIGEAFQEALTPLELDSNHRLVIFKLFDLEVTSQLGGLYTEINRLLASNGVLPQIRHGQPVNTPSRSMPPQASTPAPAPETISQNQARYNNTPSYFTGSNVAQPGFHAGTGGATTHYDQAGPYGQTGGFQGGQMASTGSAGAIPSAGSEVQRVMNEFLHGGATAVGSGIPASFSVVSTETGKSQNYYDRKDVLKALSNLQVSVSQEPETYLIDGESFKRAILADMGLRHGGAVTRQVSAVDEKTIDFIEMLFQVIIEDASISEITTNLLLRLQIPVIKIAMLDDSVFSEGEHPARRLLNAIADAGKNIIEREDPVWQQLNQVVENVLQDFEVDITTFLNALDAINQIIENEQDTSVESERQTQVEILKQHARQIVLSELQFRVASKTIPAPLHPLLLRHWSTLMFHRYIRTGKDSPEWNEAINLLVLMLESIQTPESYEQWIKVKKRHSGIINSVRDVLYGTRQKQEEVDTALAHLASHYSQLIENAQFSESAAAEDDNIPDDYAQLQQAMTDTQKFTLIMADELPPREQSPIEIEIAESQEKLSRMPDVIKPGVWFEVYDGEDRPVRRLKLSVIIVEEARLIFVNRHGKKIMEKDVDEFTQELEDERSAAIADHSVFDHALSHVINCLAAAR